MNLQHPDSPSPQHRDWLAALLLRHPDRLLSRFAAALTRWRALPRHFRRRLARRAAATAVGAAIILAMSASPLLVPSARAATITVDQVTCTLVDAIKSANTDTAVGGCVSGDAGLDTIDLQADVTLTAVAGYFHGATGLPAVTSEIVIEGNGFTIERDGAAPNFRILYVAPTGDLTLNDVTISGGDSSTFVGAGFYVSGGKLALINSTVSDNSTLSSGGGGMNESGSVTITDSIIRDNTAGAGGGLYLEYHATGIVTTQATITNSLFENNTAASGGGGAFYVDKGQLNIIGSIISGNDAAGVGGGLFTFYAQALVTVTGSTFTENVARRGGGAHIRNGDVTFINSTISGNTAAVDNGGGFYNRYGKLSLINATVTQNYAKIGGGGISQSPGHYSTTLSRSIVSGNVTGSDEGIEIASADGSITADDHNVFSHSVLTSAIAFYNFTPGASDFDASSDDNNVPIGDIFDTTLADNGGLTLTHNLVADSPAVDLAPDADCVAPSLTDGVDQRGAARPFDVAGQGNDGSDTCDIGAVEYRSPVPGETAVFMSATTAGTTGDGLDFGSEDIIRWDGSAWSLFFDGSAAGLTPTGKWKHNINAFHVDDGEDIVMSFTQNARFVPGITPKVDGMDLVMWDGSAFSLYFDGSDIGLNNKTQEKIDGLHILPGSESPVGAGCLAYLLISTQGPGRVNNGPEQGFKFGGEDVLGFCATSLGETTAGLWHLLLDGSAEGMPRNSTDSISVSDDGQTLHLTTRGTFVVDAAAGGHSMVYEYDFGSGSFSGPVFDAAAEGLPEKVDGLQVEGDLD